MSDFLHKMAVHSHERVAAALQELSLKAVQKRCEQLPPTTSLQLHAGGFDVIAEIKMRSPAEGQLEAGQSTASLLARAQHYIDGGAAALSVLTEPSRFDGALSHLTSISELARAAKVPLMRKDFLVDVYQLYEARAAGADGVLLIARILSDEVLAKMLHVAHHLGLFVLLEAFDADDLHRCNAHANDTVLIGLNCRDLTTLKIDPQRFITLCDSFPGNSTKVAESGVHSANDAVELARIGYDVALIGTALMKSDDPEAFLCILLTQARAAATLRRLDTGDKANACTSK